MSKNKIKGRIIDALRKVSWRYEARNNVRNASKVAPATFRCNDCGDAIYTGKKDLEKAGLEEFDNVRKSKINIDHIEPIVPIEGFGIMDWDWNVYIERMFCSEEGFQTLCKECHDIKTDLENKLRKEYRDEKKLDK
jgi:hypothetical protein